MADVRIRVIGEDQASKELAKVDASLGALDKAFGSFGKALTTAGAAVGTFAVTFSQAMKLGEAGATVAQTEESFNKLYGSIQNGTAALDALRSASNGTISDMGLMASSSTLLAGTTGSLNQAYKDNAGGLLEIAKASAKLNPALGDTNFMYQSLTLGLKRQSKLILDNLMLNVDATVANDKYAASIGKTADQLTEEEKKLAFLNEALAQGKTLVDQAGGAKDLNDTFQALTAQTENLTNSLKEGAYPALEQVAKSALTVINVASQLSGAFTMATDVIVGGIFFWQEQINAFAMNFTNAFRAVQSVLSGNPVEMHVISIQEAIQRATERFIEFKTVAPSAVQQTTQEMQTATESAAEFTRRVLEWQKAAVESGLKAGLAGELQKTYDEFAVSLGEVQTKSDELRLKLLELKEQGYAPNSVEVLTLTANLTGLVAEEQALYAQLEKTTAQFIYQRASQDMDAIGAAKLAESLGILSKVDAEAAIQIELMRQALDANRDGTIQASEVNQDYIDKIGKLQTALVDAAPAAKEASAAIDELAEAEKRAADETYRLNRIGEALSAGMSDTLTTSSEEYAAAMAEIQRNGDDLQSQLMQLISTGQTSGETWNTLQAAIEENNNKFWEARDAIAKTTAELIYQQAAAGLDAEAALKLAKSMGLINDADYAVAITLQRLRAQFDLNKDGAISAAEGAEEYANAVLKVNQAVSGMQISGQAITEGGLSQALSDYTGMTAPTGLTAPPGGGGGGISNSFIVNYSPGISFADEYELERAMKPIIERIVRGEK